MISCIINAKFWDTRFDNTWYHAKNNFVNSFMIHFFYQSAKEDTPPWLSLQMFENTKGTKGLETRQSMNYTW